MSVLHWPTKITEDLLLEISRANPGKFELAADGTLLTTHSTLTARDGAPFQERFDLSLDLGSHMRGFVLDVGAVFDAEQTRRRRA